MDDQASARAKYKSATGASTRMSSLRFPRSRPIVVSSIFLTIGISRYINTRNILPNITPWVTPYHNVSVHAEQESEGSREQ